MAYAIIVVDRLVINKFRHTSRIRMWDIQLNAVASLSMSAKAQKYPAKLALCCTAWPAHSPMAVILGCHRRPPHPFVFARLR